MAKCVECASYVEIIYVEDDVLKTARACAKTNVMRMMSFDEVKKGCKSFSKEKLMNGKYVKSKTFNE